MAHDKKIRFVASIQAKVIFITIALISLFLGLYAAVSFYKQKAAMHDSLLELANITATKLANNLSIPLWDLDKDLVIDTVEAEMLSKDIAAIVVYDSDGRGIFAARGRDSNWQTMPITGIKGSDDFISHQLAITQKDEYIGGVTVYISDQFKQAELHSTMIAMLVTLLLLDVVIFFVLWLVMQQMLIRPINQLSQAVERISKGQFDASLRVDSDDEIGVISHYIDRLQFSLRMAMQKLVKLNKEHKQFVDQHKKLGRSS